MFAHEAVRGLSGKPVTGNWQQQLFPFRIPNSTFRILQVSCFVEAVQQ
jgi:hypothetical protein